MKILNKIGIIILAAGKGTRMNSNMLKVMHDLRGRPLIDHVLKAVEDVGFIDKPILVVRSDDSSVQDYIGDRALYVIQEKQLGTGQAVSVAENLMRGIFDHILVLYGDMPFITTESIKKLLAKHVEENNELTLVTAEVDDYENWRSIFRDFGRVVRHNGRVVRIVEKKDASIEELMIREVNTAFFCFNANWLWENLKKLNNDNVQKEYYLTDLVKIAFESGARLSACKVDAKEALGINTKENLEVAEKIII